jgi:tetratricopeptide (TPR) repeat protein
MKLVSLLKNNKSISVFLCLILFVLFFVKSLSFIVPGLYLYQSRSLQGDFKIEKMLKAYSWNNDVNILFDIADVYVEENNFESAIEFLLKANRIRPNSPMFQLKLIETYERNGQFLEAKSIWEQQPIDVARFINIAIEYQDEKDYRSALLYYSRAFYLQDEFEEKYNNSPVYDELVNIVNYVNDVGDHSLILGFGDKPSEVDAFSFLINYVVGMEYFNLNDMVMAKEFLFRAANNYNLSDKFDVVLSDNYRLVGLYYWGVDNMPKAYEYAKKAIDLNKASFWNHIHFGKIAYLYDTSYEEITKEHFSQALLITNNDPYIFDNLIDYWELTQRQDNIYDLCKKVDLTNFPVYIRSKCE